MIFRQMKEGGRAGKGRLQLQACGTFGYNAAWTCRQSKQKMERANPMRSFTSMTRDRGVTTVPAHLRQTASMQANTPLIWVELEPQLWLVGPEARHPEQAAPLVAAALLSGQSPFPKLMQRIMSGDISEPDGSERCRRYRPTMVSDLTEEQMISRGSPLTSSPRHRRGRQ